MDNNKKIYEGFFVDEDGIKYARDLHNGFFEITDIIPKEIFIEAFKKFVLKEN